MPTTNESLDTLSAAALASLQRLPGVRQGLFWFDPERCRLRGGPLRTPLSLLQSAALGLLGCEQGWRELAPELARLLGLYEGGHWHAAALAGIGYVVVDADDSLRFASAVMEEARVAWGAALALAAPSPEPRAWAGEALSPEDTVVALPDGALALRHPGPYSAAPI